MSEGLIAETQKLTEAVYYLADIIAKATQQPTRADLFAKQEEEDIKLKAQIDAMARMEVERRLAAMQSGRSPDALPSAATGAPGAPRRPPAPPARPATPGSVILGPAPTTEGQG